MSEGKIGLRQVPMTRERAAKSLMNETIKDLYGKNAVFEEEMILHSSAIAVCALELGLLTGDYLTYAKTRGGSLFDYLESETDEAGVEFMAHAQLSVADILNLLPSEKLDTEYRDITANDLYETGEKSSPMALEVITKLKGTENKRLRLVLSRHDIPSWPSIPIDISVLHMVSTVKREALEHMDEVVLRSPNIRELILKTRTPHYHGKLVRTQ